MYKLYDITTSIYIILILFSLFYIATHFFVNISLYSIIKPLKKRINLFEAKYLIIYFVPIVIYLTSNKLLEITFPCCSNFTPLYSFAVFFSIFAIYFAYHLFLISKSYREVGFVHKPYIFGGLGALTLIISALIVFTCILMYIEPSARSRLYYYSSFYLISYVFSINFYMRFIFEYPSLLESNWCDVISVTRRM